jgi:DNA transformation protein and related proteins
MDAADLEDLFQPVLRVNARRMFGGHGISANGMMFAVQIDGSVWLRADAETEDRFREAGSHPFSYGTKTGRTIAMPYWRMPEAAYEDPDVLREWVVLARGAAERHARAKAAKGERGAKTARVRAATARKRKAQATSE